jgi:hypothetical protein
LSWCLFFPGQIITAVETCKNPATGASLVAHLLDRFEPCPPQIFVKLLQLGLDPNGHVAIGRRAADARGADDAPPSAKKRKTDEEHPPCALVLAAKRGQVEVVELLLSCGVDGTAGRSVGGYFPATEAKRELYSQSQNTVRMISIRIRLRAHYSPFHRDRTL